ncbi:MAG: hypothetical protein QM831_36165 [Kofleriaceae bacterium]
MLAIWLPAGFVLGGILLIHHMVALPVPPASDARARAAFQTDLPQARWRLFHVLYRGCGCSRRVIDHLLAGPRPQDVIEEVVMADDHRLPSDFDDRLRAAGFTVRVVDPDQLAEHYHLEAAPVLAIMRPDGTVGYLGGYNRHKQAPLFEDVAVLEKLRRHETPGPLPLYGCATSSRLAARADVLP